ncbi:hypothetical protein [Paenibacillus sp. MMS20-IR301]|uniref:hypothetical protein n=1 Tax=Paenibacillus sp. MMS20-IR301 TaxID=2895946 RepID=UPI0028E89F8A|nr:hypothetical protein [Paenibacillus sp. MMS20-IR301]WNS45264.1 hypothetical protein LOS79_08335 [Paenibacillus sp. MMS20-IR301]
MSSYIVKIIPENDKIVPSQTERTSIINQLKEVTSSTEIIERLYDEVTFIDAGANFEGIACNHCLRELDTGWWAEQVDVSSSNKFNDLLVTTPCCCSLVSLNELKYIWPAGFAKYAIELLNPDEADVIEIEKITSAQSFKLIRAHY